MLTLGIHEVVNQHVVTLEDVHRGILEALVRAITHVLLAESLDLGVDVVGVL